MFLLQLRSLLLKIVHNLHFGQLYFSNKFRNPWASFLKDQEENLAGLSTPLKQIAAEPFSQHVAKILHRSVSNPLLK